MSKLRVVSVSDRRATERMYRVVQSAAFEVGLTPEQAQALAKAAAKAAVDEGLVLTWQVKS